MVLAGCGTVKNVVQTYDITKNTSKGLILMSVTHDRGKATTFRGGSGIDLELMFREAATSEYMTWVENYDGDSVFGEEIEGKILAVELNSGWHQLMGLDFQQLQRKQKFSPINFDVKPGVVQYLGNIHVNFIWGASTMYVPVSIGIVVPIEYAAPKGVKAFFSDKSELDLNLVFDEYPQLKGKVEKALLRPGPWIQGLEKP